MDREGKAISNSNETGWEKIFSSRHGFQPPVPARRPVRSCGLGQGILDSLPDFGSLLLADVHVLACVWKATIAPATMVSFYLLALARKFFYKIDKQVELRYFLHTTLCSLAVPQRGWPVTPLWRIHLDA